MTYPVTFYVRPNGKQVEKEITQISPLAEEFFHRYSIRISMEELTEGRYCIWADYGRELEDGTPDEYIYIVPEGETCYVSLDKVAQAVEARL